MYGNENIEGCDDCFGPRGGRANGLPCTDAAVRRGLVWCHANLRLPDRL